MNLTAIVAAALLFGSAIPYSVFAQTPSAAKKHADPQADLNRLLNDAQAAIEKRDYDTAARDYSDYLAKRPEDALVHFNLGFVFTAEGKPDAARPEYAKAIAIDPKMAAAYLNLGLTILPSDPAAAVAPLRQATQLQPDNSRAGFFLGLALERSGKTADAIEQYKAAEHLDAKGLDIRLALGHAAAAAHQPDEAAKAYRDALALQPDENDTAQAHLGLARALLDAKQPDVAAAEFRAYLQLRPNDAAVRAQYAQILAGEGKSDDALAALNATPATGADQLATLKISAQLQIQANRTDDAIATLLKAERLAPKDPALPVQAAELYLKKKDYENAGHQLTTAFNLNPSNSNVLKALIGAEYQAKNYPTALEGIALLEKRMALPLDALFVRAACYDKLNQIAAALDAYKAFLQVNKDENSDMYFESTVRVRVLTRELQEKKK